MPYDLRIIRCQDFLHLDAQGHFDEVTTRRLFRDAIWACVQSHIGRILVDVRQATADLSAAQLSGLANVTAEVSPPPSKHKIAILTRPELQFTRATFVANLVQNEGWNVAAFHAFEEAFRWLLAEDDTSCVYRPPA